MAKGRAKSSMHADTYPRKTIIPCTSFKFGVVSPSKHLTNPISPLPVPLFTALEEADFVEADNNSESEEEISSDDNRHEDDSKHDDIHSEEEEHADDAEKSDEDDGLEEELDTDDNSDLSDDDDDDDDKPGSQSDKNDKMGFLAGGKAASFAKAFAKVLGKPAAGTITAPSKAAVPILAKSKSLADRQARDADLVFKDREAKRARLEMKQRGRMQPKPKGQDPEADAIEKELLKTATRGVVKLFNAVAKAQKQMRESHDMTGNRLKAAKASRSSFIDELKNRQSSGGGAGGGGKMKDVKGRNDNEEDNDKDGSGGNQPRWDVLKDGFAGLGGKSKMKDWDRKVEIDSDGGMGDVVDMDSDGE